ncbi:MAG TPA: NAD(P)/FAD-dependent oxidoreductase [Rhabdochlamydiaceae bacterium]|jgi:predicted Rossmann fold flavoprotein|nr:NAD(P)/FAD-dependent oxidoreductase [Rhabdochlamydiaceae bacterium]
MNLIVIGGGAAGIFAALAAKQAHSTLSVLVLEKTAVLLSKVKVSGGGRCNVTHACFDPQQLVKNYPRGEKELLGPFHRFQPRDTIEWFESRGVKLKTESDGRMFPVTDSSSTIIECLLSEARKLGVEIRQRQRVEKIEKGFTVHLKDSPALTCSHLILATGSSPEGYAGAESLGHTIQPPVPSLFTFNVPTSPLKELSGVSVEAATVDVGPFTQTGPLLITHFGFSGPAILKLSAWGARFLHEKNYRTPFSINWIPKLSQEDLLRQLLQLKEQSPQKTLFSLNPFYLPKNLWKELLSNDKTLANLSKKELQELAQKLHADTYQMDGKTTHKEEFVTCGGVTLKEVDFKTLQSKICPQLYFAGEVLNIDGVTGGFNFQNAWTTGYIAGTSIYSLA